MSPTTDISMDSILHLMERSHLAREAGALTETEFVELNSLANRLKFAGDFNKPAFVTSEERSRFAHLAGKVSANLPGSHSSSRAKRSIKTNSLRSTPTVMAV
jgi:hypothetical protein